MAEVKPARLKAKTGYGKAMLLTCLCSFTLTAVILLIAYLFLGFAPFGTQALLYRDGQQQMVDLFCWYKDVLTGNSSIAYTFTKYLGGSNFAVFSYYLSSPFSLLVVFFEKSQMPLFLNVIYLLKASVAALTACYYINRRFRPDNAAKLSVVIILSASYALGQFMIAQSSNVMWLDGVYMLPLLLAGVEKIVSEKKSALFILSAGLALCFNWYTGIIDLMFSGIWLLFEILRVELIGGTEKGKGLKLFLSAVLRFAVSSVSALLISCVIMLPTLTLLSGRTYGKSDISAIFDMSLIGPVPTVISNYSFGYISIKGEVNLFAGSFVFLGVFLLFFSNRKLKDKLVYLLLLLVTVLSYYWQPLVYLFSMLRNVDSFWYRYSYTGIFAFVYLAAVFYLESEAVKTKLFIPPIVSAFYCVIVILTSDPKYHSTAEVLFTQQMSAILGTPMDYHLVPLVAKLVFPIVTSLVLCAAFSLRLEKRPCFRTSSVLLALILITELLFSQLVLAKVYSTDDGPSISNYTNNEIALLDKINDPSFHRVLQTSYHSQFHNLAASYSEPMAYGFNSVTAFVSAPDENAVRFLDKAGYVSYYYTIPVTVSENIALDSLLSVKYVLLPVKDDNNAGLEKISDVPGFKALYKNPYAVPPAFVVDKNSAKADGTDPMLYLNGIYKNLTGLDKDIFVPVKCSATKIEKENDKATYSYTFFAYNYGYSIYYANLVTDTDKGATLYMNDVAYTPYSEEMAPTVVRVVPAMDGRIELELRFKNKGDFKVTDMQLYAVDQAALKEATDILKKNAASKIEITDGHCRFEVNDGAEGKSLFTSIPYAKGWTITRNGTKIECDLTEDTFITIPLENGTNVIEMDYSIPNFTPGIIATLAGVVLLLGVVVFEQRKKA